MSSPIFMFMILKEMIQTSIVLECKCNKEGSTNNVCNVETGECDCKNMYIIGDKCEKCMEGHYKHPECKGTVI